MRPAARLTHLALILALLGVTRTLLAVRPTSFEEGLAAFDAAAAYASDHPSDAAGARERYARAAEHFVEAWRSGTLSASVLLNAANSYGFAESYGQAVLFYKRALAVDPGHDDARQGLEHIRSQLPIQVPRRDETSLADALFFWHKAENFTLRKTAFLTLFPLAWLLFALELGARRRSSWSGPYALAGYLGLVLSLAMLGSLLYEQTTRDPASAAVIVVEVRGRTGPGEQYQPSHTRLGTESEPLSLPPGTEVQILDTSPQDWIEAELLDGSRTFLPGATVERVLPRDS